MSLPYRESNIPLAKKLRKEMTRQERRLWYECLRLMPARFQRQKAIGPYIVDFYCHGAKLVIELDGGQHFETEGQEKDARRDAYLEGMGLRVLRLSNADVDQHFFAACESIVHLLGSLSEGAVGEAD